MTNAEVVTTAIPASLRFRSNFELARHLLQDEGYIPHMLGKKPLQSPIAWHPTLVFDLVRLAGENLETTQPPIDLCAGQLPYCRL